MIIEFAFLIVALVPYEQQRDAKVYCNDSKCYTEVGGFKDAAGCTLALLTTQEDMRRKGWKIVVVEGGNKCFQREARKFTEKP